MSADATRVTSNRPAATSRNANRRTDGKRRNGHKGRAQALLSVVIPTRNEAGNIEEVVTRIERATTGFPAEIIFVDDSTDDTPAAVSAVSRRSRLPVSLIHRPPERRGNGLGGAVVEGMRAATGQWVCVMDADLQHPPELIPSLLQHARGTSADVVVASRFAESANAGGLNPARFLISKLSVLAARLLFPRRLRQVSDPMSGYFLVRRESVDTTRLQPRGFKILLEILVRFPRLSASQVPFEFGSRYSGQSKAGLREGLRYLAGLLGLRFGGVLQRATRFGLVGASGIVVNQLLLAAFTDLAGLHYLFSAMLATQGSTLSNFVLAEAWVFGDRSGGRLRLRRLGQFLLVNNGMLLLRGPFLFALTSGLGIHYLVSNLITLLVLVLARYIVADGWIWSNSLAKPRQKTFAYDVHGILSIVSEARLPELDYFSTTEPVERPDIRVSTRRSASVGEEVSEATNGNHSRFRYHEGLGPLGFWVEITRGQSMDVVVGHLVKLSPHVLYTNVVEPILRWMLVQKGYALVHGACTCVDGQAALVTARTDTGKTTTILRLLAHHPLAFLSDDMVILRRDGQLLSYPKPLTISRHTLGAVNQATLSLWQRLALVVQSRVHSKSGRRTALSLTRMPLPMASVNAIAQIVVPPPKYFIDQLIPGVTTCREGKLSRLIVIEIGDDLEVSLNPPEAVKTLLRNCEDAYGFPPYAALAPFLYFWNGEDLRIMERDIINEALAGCPATLIRSKTRSWWERLPSLLGVCAPVRGAMSGPEPALEAPGAYAASQRPGAEPIPAAARWEEDDLPEWL